MKTVVVRKPTFSTILLMLLCCFEAEFFVCRFHLFKRTAIYEVFFSTQTDH